MTSYPSDPLEAVAFSFILQSCEATPETQQAALAVLAARLREEIPAEQALEQCQALLGTAQPAKRVNDIIDTPVDPIPYRHSAADSFAVRSARHKARTWSAYEDQRLFAAVRKFGLENWSIVAEFVGNGRTRSQCSQRWFRGLNPSLFKGPWTKEEEEKLVKLVQEFGEKSWKRIAALFGNRSDVQCRYHYQQMQKHGVTPAITKPAESEESVTPVEPEERPLLIANDIESIPFEVSATVDQIFDMNSDNFWAQAPNPTWFSLGGLDDF